MDGLEPLRERDVAALKDRASADGKLLAAPVALVEPLSFAVELRDLMKAAERALSAVWPA